MIDNEASILRVTGLEVRFTRPRTFSEFVFRRPQRVIQAVNGVDLAVRAGETLGIVGESGCGKSTLARCLVGLTKPTDGVVQFRGQDIHALGKPERTDFHRRVQMVFQDPYGSLNPRKTPRQILSEALRVHRRCSADQVETRVIALLDQVGLPARAADRKPHEFSGGQRQRIAIARALSVEPDCIVADELVSALDVSVQAQIVNLLLTLQRELKLTIVFIAHDLRLVRHVSHRVAVMYLGRLVELGDAEGIFAQPRHPYSQMLLSAAAGRAKGANRHISSFGELPSPANLPPGCSFQGRCPLATDTCRSRVPEPRILADGSLVACHRVDEPTAINR